MLRFLLALWHVIGILLLAVLVTEFGVEGWRRASRWLRYRRPTRPDRTAAADAYADADWSAAYFDEFHRAVRVDWKPYVEWWQRPVRGIHVTIDERGLRPTPGEADAPADAIHILCFGGSTMMGMGARDGHTIPAVLARQLGELGYKAAVTNYGQLGHNSTQETITLQQLVKAGERIDIVVFYDGINEMACAEQTGRADGLFNEARRRAEFNLLLPDRRRDLIVAALMAAAPRTLRRLRQLTGLALHGPLPAPPADLSRLDMAGLAQEVVALYIRKSAADPDAGARIRLSPGLFLAAGDYHQKKSRPSTSSAGNAITPTTRLRALGSIPRSSTSAAIAASSPKPSTRSISPPSLTHRTDPVYIDLYHLSEAGNAAVAEAMLPAIAAAADALGQDRRRRQMPRPG